MATTLEILLVEDDPDVRGVLASSLADAGYRVTEAAEGEAALRRLGTRVFDVVVTDLRLPKAGGMEVFEAARRESPSTEVILMTSFSNVADAVAALKAGASDYLTKPFEPEELVLRLRRIAETRALQRELAAARAELAGEASAPLVGASPAIARLMARVDAVAKSDAPVLIQGETGTGKELIARTVHARSDRRGGPFLAVNCAAFPEGLLEAELFGHERGAFTGAVRRREGRFRAAHRGTLLLDELGEMPLAAQAKLLRVLEEGVIEPLGSNEPIPVDVRILSATHRNLRKMIAEGRFREDLYFRLNVVALDVPPLRERAGDLPLLVQHFLQKFAPAEGPAPQLSLASWSALVRHEWPGNVRELAHALRHAVLLARGVMIEPDHLPHDVVGGPTPKVASANVRPLAASVKDFERDQLLRALSASSGKRTRAAEILGISRKTLWEKLRAHGISDADIDE